MSSFFRFFSCVLVFCFLAASAQAAEMTLTKIAAVVNGEMITLHDLQKNAAAEMGRQGIPLNDPRAAQAERTILDMMINDILIRQDAERYKITVSAQEVDNEVRKIAQQNKMSVPAFEAHIARQGTTVEDLKTKLKNSMLRQRMNNLMIQRKVVVTDDDIQTYYDAHKAEFSGRRSADFSVIVFKPGVRAGEVYNHIKSGALSFEDAARSYSEDASAPNGGRIGLVPWERLSAPMQKLFDSLSPEEISPIITMESKTAVFKLHSKGEGVSLSLAEARPAIEKTLRAVKLEERFEEYCRQLRAKAVIDIRL